MPCYTIGGGTGFMCARGGSLGPHCAKCGSVADVLCDYPVGKDKTCDRPLCAECAHEVAPDVHYCAGHFEEWERFLQSGGVEQELSNVVPFKRPEG